MLIHPVPQNKLVFPNLQFWKPDSGVPTKVFQLPIE